MNKKDIKRSLILWEEEQIKELEQEASQSKYIFSKEFEKKIDGIYEKKEKKQNRKYRINKVAIAAGFCLFIIIGYSFNIQGLAANLLEDFLHLKIDVIQEDNTGKKIKETYRPQEDMSVKIERKEDHSIEMIVAFDTLINMTEREYWNYLKENELSTTRGPKYLPTGYKLDKRKNQSWYSYVYEEKAEDEFLDTKTLEEIFPNTGFVRVDKKKPLTSGKDFIKIKGRNVKLVLREIGKTWRKGKNELCYYERINDWTKKTEYYNIKSCEKILIGEQEAYILKAKDKIYITFYQETSRIILSGIGENQELIYQELLKMAESLL